MGVYELGHWGAFDYPNGPANHDEVFGCDWSGGFQSGSQTYYEQNCQTVALPSSPGQTVSVNTDERAHAMEMLGLINGNVIQGQDPNMSSDLENRSGFSPEAVGMLSYTNDDEFLDGLGCGPRSA